MSLERAARHPRKRAGLGSEGFANTEANSGSPSILTIPLRHASGAGGRGGLLLPSSGQKNPKPEMDWPRCSKHGDDQEEGTDGVYPLDRGMLGIRKLWKS